MSAIPTGGGADDDQGPRPVGYPVIYTGTWDGTTLAWDDDHEPTTLQTRRVLQALAHSPLDGTLYFQLTPLGVQIASEPVSPPPPDLSLVEAWGRLVEDVRRGFAKLTSPPPAPKGQRHGAQATMYSVDEPSFAWAERNKGVLTIDGIDYPFRAINIDWAGGEMEIEIEDRFESERLSEWSGEAPNELHAWWVEDAEEIGNKTIDKMLEYGSGDLVEVGSRLNSLSGTYEDPTPGELMELGCLFYLNGKLERVWSAVRRGEAGSDDTWLDIEVYAKMVRAMRAGAWEIE